jgi:hypothetical protein
MSRTSSTQPGSDDHLADPEGGEKQDEETKPKPVGFWHQDMKHVRKNVFIQWARTG